MKNNIVFRNVAKLKPWYYLFSFFIAISYAAVNDGDRVWHWRYLVAYALFALFVISYFVRYKSEVQEVATTKPANVAEKSKDLGFKALSLALQLLYGCVLSFIYASALQVVGGEGFSVKVSILLVFLLLVIGAQSTVEIQQYSRLFADTRRAVYWLGTSTLLLFTFVATNISLYGPALYSFKEMLIALGVTLPFQIIGYFAMKVGVSDPASESKKV